jgi:hypothetical protein
VTALYACSACGRAIEGSSPYGEVCEACGKANAVESPRYLAVFAAYVGSAALALDLTSLTNEAAAAEMPRIKERAHYWAALSEKIQPEGVTDGSR